MEGIVMPKDQFKHPMRIRLSEERRTRMMCSLKQYFMEHFDEELSDFRAENLLDFFVKELGAPVYNQAIQDAYACMQDKLTDLTGEFYEPEEPYAR
jgi:uncharacterized protein (DUF2164 family)